MFALARTASASSASPDLESGSSEDDWSSAQSTPTYFLKPIAELKNHPERRLNRAYAYEAAKVIETNYGIEGLADFLDAIAYWESRYNPEASGDSGQSLGMFQLRYTSAFDTADGLDYLRNTSEGYELLTDIDTSILFATDHIIDAIKRSRTSGVNRPCGTGVGPGDYLSARRWWKYPSLVHDYCESNETSAQIRGRLETALNVTGHSESLMYEKPNISNWPGIKQALADFNISV